jgi:hypothetical protein
MPCEHKEGLGGRYLQQAGGSGVSTGHRFQIQSGHRLQIQSGHFISAPCPPAGMHNRSKQQQRQRERGTAAAVFGWIRH